MNDPIERGKHAEALLKDPLIDGFFSEFDKEIFNRWTVTADFNQREDLYRLKVAADAMKSHLMSYILTGKLEADK